MRFAVLVPNYIVITEKPTDDDPNLLSSKNTVLIEAMITLLLFSSQKATCYKLY